MLPFRWRIGSFLRGTDLNWPSVRRGMHWRRPLRRGVGGPREAHSNWAIPEKISTHLSLHGSFLNSKDRAWTGRPLGKRGRSAREAPRYHGAHRPRGRDRHPGWERGLVHIGTVRIVESVPPDGSNSTGQESIDQKCCSCNSLLFRLTRNLLLRMPNGIVKAPTGADRRRSAGSRRHRRPTLALSRRVIPEHGVVWRMLATPSGRGDSGRSWRRLTIPRAALHHECPVPDVAGPSGARDAGPFTGLLARPRRAPLAPDVPHHSE